MSKALIGALFAMATGLAASAATAGEPAIFYWEKQADDGKVLEALKQQRITPFVLKGKSYYDDRTLGSNAILCGKRTDRAALRRFARTVIEAGAKIQYIGPYYKAEMNSFRNSIDLRSINGPRYFKTARVLTLDDLKRMNWRNPSLCGVRPLPR